MENVKVMYSSQYHLWMTCIAAKNYKILPTLKSSNNSFLLFFSQYTQSHQPFVPQAKMNGSWNLEDLESDEFYSALH